MPRVVYEPGALNALRAGPGRNNREPHCSPRLYSGEWNSEEFR